MAVVGVAGTGFFRVGDTLRERVAVRRRKPGLLLGACTGLRRDASATHPVNGGIHDHAKQKDSQKECVAQSFHISKHTRNVPYVPCNFKLFLDMMTERSRIQIILLARCYDSVIGVIASLHEAGRITR